MARGKLSFTPQIAKPCEESWLAIQGGVRERHCEACDKRVYNFAAMTPAEIEKLVMRSGGKLCARITRREDGSLVTLEAQPRMPLAAQIVVSASLMIGAAGAAAQSGVKQDSMPQAVLTGKVLRSDGSGPLDGATITLLAEGSTIVTARSDVDGSFKAFVTPGTYDLEIKNGLEVTRLHAVLLQDGQQTFGALSAASTVVVQAYAAGEYRAIMGTMAVTTHYSFWYIFRHPIQYAKHLTYKQ